jgi:hypothetical protein
MFPDVALSSLAFSIPIYDDFTFILRCLVKRSFPLLLQPAQFRTVSAAIPAVGNTVPPLVVSFTAQWPSHARAA